jgi:hypothetical protein
MESALCAAKAATAARSSSGVPTVVASRTTFCRFRAASWTPRAIAEKYGSVVNDHSYQPGSRLCQTLGLCVGDIAEGFGYIPYALADFRAGGSGGAVEDAGGR